MLNTDISLPDEEIIRLYGKRWDSEVFFMVDKQHLNLIKEIQTRDYDALIAHTTIVILRYNFLSRYQRISKDNRTCGSLFRQCCQEMENLKFIDALQRILAVTFQAIRKSRKY